MKLTRIISFLALSLLISMSSCRSYKSTQFQMTADDIYYNEEGTGKIDYKPDGKLTGARKKIVEEACSWIGTPYVYAGQQKGKGTDCSGMVMVVYKDVTGVKIPRNSAKQAEFCREIKGKQVEAGDLVFFATGKDPSKVSHVGIMLNSKEFVHASSSKGVVISTMDNAYFTRHFIMYGRVPFN